MSFQIQQGLFKFEFNDQYAILGVPVTAEASEIRKQYIKIARFLHPDRCKSKPEAERNLANQLFSKLVNPAYEKLFSDKGRAESKVTLGRVGQRLAKEAPRIQLQSEVAKQLAQTGGDIDLVYTTTLKNLAEHQYQEIDKAVEAIAQISELNMVYLMRKGNQLNQKAAATSSSTTTTTQTTGTAPPPPPPAVDKKAEELSQKVEPYCRRAEEYMSKNNFTKATLELRDALQLDPNNSRAHGLMGMNYLHQNQATMAKVHVNKSLQLNPKDEIGLKAKEILEKQAAKASGGSKQTNTSKPAAGGKPAPGKPDDKSGGSSFFGIKFGGGKKK